MIENMKSRRCFSLNHMASNCFVIAFVLLANISFIHGLHDDNNITHNDGYYNILQIHGSGTTNPSKCIWNIMNEFMYSSSLPIRMTFRAIGTANGIDEFMNDTMNYTLSNQNNIAPTERIESLPIFSIGDYSLSTEEYKIANGIVTDDDDNIGFEVLSNDSNIIQLPIVAGAVNFFHNVPNIRELNLNACLLARIFTLDITTWDHPDLLEENPTLPSLPIKVIVRDGKSGSALAISSYLNEACEAHFPDTLVSDLPNWSLYLQNDNVTGTATYHNASGSQGMADMIDNDIGTIGFVDSGHGIENKLKEIKLYNSFQYITSYDSYLNNGISAAVTRDDYPTTADLNFKKQIQFVYKDSQNISINTFIWPIVLVSTLYIPKDLTYILPNPIQRSLFYTFLQSLYDVDYIDVCTKNYMFATLSDDIQTFGREGIELLMNYSNNNYNVSTDLWYTEKKASSIAASYPYVISTRRSDVATIERNALQQQIYGLEATIKDATLLIEVLDYELDQLKESFKDISVSSTTPAATTGSSTTNNAEVEQVNMNSSNNTDNEKRINTSFAFSLISFLLWIVYGIVQMYHFFGNNKSLDYCNSKRNNNMGVTANGTSHDSSSNVDEDEYKIDKSSSGHV